MTMGDVRSEWRRITQESFSTDFGSSLQAQKKPRSCTWARIFSDYAWLSSAAAVFRPTASG